MLRKYLEMPCTKAKSCGAFFTAKKLRYFLSLLPPHKMLRTYPVVSQ